MTEDNIRYLMGLLDCGKGLAKNATGWVHFECPYAPETHAKGVDNGCKFGVKEERNGLSAYSCFVCHETGTMIDLVEKLAAMRGEDYGHLAAICCGLEIPGQFDDYDESLVLQDLQKKTLDTELMFALYPLAWEQRPAREYLIKRGVSQATAALLDLRYDPDKKYILFPVLSPGRLLHGFAGRSIFDSIKAKTYNYAPLKTSLFLLGEHLARPGYEKVLVEGQFAFAHLVEIGAREFCDPVASFGSRLSAVQAGKLIEWGDPVHLLYDDDLPGSEGIYGSCLNKGTPYAPPQFRGGGAFDFLREEIPVYISSYPARTGDPDALTVDEVYDMIFF